jgi:predicted dehydrogenase
MYETCGNQTMARGAYIELRGTRGTLFINDSQFEIMPETGGQFQQRRPRTEPMVQKSSEGNHTVQHARNFLDCMRTREKPNADVEEGHRSTTMSLMAKISWLTESRLKWDPDAERFPGNDQADAMLHYDYRKPWTLESS